MNRLINYLIYLFVIVVIIFGFVQLNNENTIFAESRIPCCKAGNCQGIPCSTTSTVYLKWDGCAGYILTCEDCMMLGGTCDQPEQTCISD